MKAILIFTFLILFRLYSFSQGVFKDNPVDRMITEVTYRSTSDYQSAPKEKSSPLYVLDGKKKSERWILKHQHSFFIYQIEVLTDSAATVRYGKKGINGAILITTKK